MRSSQLDQQLIPQIPCIIYDSEIWRQDAEFQCDCACAVNPLEVQPGRIGFPPDMTMARTAQPFVTVPLHSDYCAALVGQTPGVIVLNDPALTIARHFEQSHAITSLPAAWRDDWGSPIVQATLERMMQLGILVAPDQSALKMPDVATTLVAWLHLTERCNLRCSYCYLPQGLQEMSIATGKAVLDSTFHTASTRGYRQVKLKYAGGEPLLCFSKVVELHRYAQSQAIQHGVSLDSVVLSNGTLLNVLMIEMMKTSGLRLMISLDGLQAFHDLHRTRVDGRGTFAEVQRAIDLALDHQLIPEISVTVSNVNVGGLPDLVEWLLERDLPFGLNFYRENSCSIRYQNLRLIEQDMIDGMLKVFAVIEQNLPRRSLLTSLVDHVNLAIPHVHPCHVGRSYLVFDPYGRVAKCQMQLDEAVDLTSLPNPLVLLGDDSNALQNPSVEEKEDCRDCDWKYWCAGGCPLATWRATGRYDARSPNCRIYQTLLPAGLRLEGLRLLKYIA